VIHMRKEIYTGTLLKSLNKRISLEDFGVDRTIVLQDSTYRVSREECIILRERVPYVKIYRYNPEHLYPNLNVYGDKDQRKVWSTSGFHTLYLPVDRLMHARPSVRYRIAPYAISKLHTFMLIMQCSLRIRCEWLVTFRVTSALYDSYSMYSVWNPTDNYGIVASVFVVQFNGFMSLIC
jgi:hypothetical protein